MDDSDFLYLVGDKHCDLTREQQLYYFHYWVEQSNFVSKLWRENKKEVAEKNLRSDFSYVRDQLKWKEMSDFT